MQVSMQFINVSNLRAHVSNDIFYIPKTFQWLNSRQCILSRCIYNYITHNNKLHEIFWPVKRILIERLNDIFSYLRVFYYMHIDK